MLLAGWLDSAISGMGIWITVGVYKLAAFVFKIFIILSTGELLDESAYETIISNFYIVLGIILLFFISFTLLKNMVSSDDDTKKSATTIKKIIINLITSAIIMALLPTIFSFAFDFQTAVVVENNVIANFFGYGNGSSTSSDNQIKNVGIASNKVTNAIYTAFFNVDLDVCKEKYPDLVKDMEGKQALEVCQQLDETNVSYGAGITDFYNIIKKVDKDGSFGVYAKFSGLVGDIIDFNFLVCLAGGIALIFVGISYCFDMALRLVKLVFYQLIAPIPLFMRVVPDTKMSGIFNKWISITLTCYLEVYIRIFVFYFCVYLCSYMIESEFLGTKVFKYGAFTGLITKAFVLMGVITFMKQAPKLFSEITGIDSGNMKLGIREKFAEGGGFAAGALVGGAVTGLGRNAANAVRNIHDNWKGASKGERFKMLAKGVGSTIAGTASGAYNSGRTGIKAKNGSDMKGAILKGGTAVDKNRVTRESKNQRYKATGGNKFTQGALGGRVMDALHNVEDYFTGGADRYANIIKTADEVTAAYEAIEQQAQKIIDKHINEVGIVGKLGSSDFAKKINGSELEEVYTKYKDASLAQIRADLSRLENEEPISTINKEDYKKLNLITGKEEFDEAGYRDAVDKARINHSKQIANTREMLTMLEKKTVENVIQNAVGYGDKGEAWGNIENKELMGTLSAAKEFEAIYKSSGNSVVDPISGVSYEKAIDLRADDVQKYMSDISGAYKNVGNQAKQKSADMRRNAEQRKGDK